MELRYAQGAKELDALEPLWNALQKHHSAIMPALGGRAAPRQLADAWSRRRAKYALWLTDPESFFVVAEKGNRAVGYAFVTVTPGYSGWATGRLAELETLSVLPEHRQGRVGSELLEAVWSRLTEFGIDDMAIRVAITNIEAHRFYERHGLRQAFVVYYGKR